MTNLLLKILLILTPTLLLANIDAVTDNQTKIIGKGFIKEQSQKNISAIIQKAKIIQQNITGDSVTGDDFGYDVAVLGNRAIIGIPGSYGTGQAFIYDFNGSDWIHSATLNPVDNNGISGLHSKFGYKVSLHNDRAVVRSANDINSYQFTINIFKFDGSDWNYENTLIAQSEFSTSFGQEYSLYDDKIVVSEIAFFDGLGMPKKKKVYIFEFNGTDWIFKDTIIEIAQNSFQPNELLVSLDDDTIFIGNPYEQDSSTAMGSVFVFEYDGTNWSQTVLSQPADLHSGAKFGYSVSISGDKAMVGAVGLKGEGAVYYYKKNIAGIWEETNKLSYHPNADISSFGRLVKLDNQTAIIGGYNGNNKTAYIYQLENDVWIQKLVLPTNDITVSNQFAANFSINGTTAIFGDRDGNDNNSGTTYIYSLDNVDWELTKHFVREDRTTEKQFGSVVELSANHAMVATSKHENLSSSVFVYNKEGKNWNFSQKLIPSTPSLSFGFDISMDGQRSLISAVDIDKVFVFELINDNWVETDILIPNDSNFDFLGSTVELYGNRAIFSAEDINNFSLIYIFDYDGNSWEQTAVIDLPYNYLGRSISLFQDRILTSSLTPGIGLEGLIFDFDGFSWNNTAVLSSENNNSFLPSVSLFGDKAIIQTQGDFNALTGVTIFESTGSGWIKSGEIQFDNDLFFFQDTAFPIEIEQDTILMSYTDYVQSRINAYKIKSGVWEKSPIIQEDGYLSDFFGISTSMFRNEIIVGASGDDDNALDTGSAYIFKIILEDLIFKDGFEN